MKNYLKILFILIINIFTIKIFAQSPEVFKYQAIVRNTSGDVLANQNVSFRISILKNNTSGTLVYEEIHTVTTNSYGLVNLNIGEGSVVSGSLSTINWANDKYFLKVELDPSGGTTYLSMGTSQLLSVPYALYAKSAGTVPDGWKITGNTGTIPWVNFIGTIDNKDFDVRTNNTLKWRFTTNGTLEFLNTGNSVFIGESAGVNDDLTNNQNVFIGYKAGNSNTTGYYNIATGYQTLYSNTTGNYNTANGWGALYSNTTSNSNTANGWGTLYSNTTGNNNTANGTSALYFNTTGYQNTANGNEALYSNTTGSYNTANGSVALHSNTTGSANTANGSMALYSNTTGSANTANGFKSLYYNTTGYENTANGNEALLYNITGNNNVALGYKTGFGAFNTDFNNCTFIGANSYPTVARTNVTMLGYGISNSQCTGDNQVLLGNTSVNQIRANVSSITTYSDARMKFNVKDDVKGLDFIMKLKPVTYNEDPTILHKIWGTPDSLLKNLDHSQIKQQRFIGFLAQDVEQAAKESGFAFPGIDVPSNDKEVYSLRYVDFIMPMVKAIQEQQGIIEIQNEINNNQQTIIDNQQKIINELKRDNENMKKELQELKQLIIENINK
jgi:hypothetical protein